MADAPPKIPTTQAAGASIPKLGLGTFQLRGDTCVEIVSQALELGYPHIDTAQGYANETEVGEGIVASRRPRSEIFVTTKVQPQLMGTGDLEASVEASLRRLGLDYIDLLLLHWPNPSIPLEQSIRALNAVQRQGFAWHIGVSNFPSTLLQQAIELSDAPLATEQIEYHPYLDQTKMLAALRARGMAITAYSPIALGGVSGDPEIEAIGNSHGRTAAQVTLRWLVQQPDVIAIPRTSKLSRLAENLAVFDFALSADEMRRMGSLTRPNSRLINEPQWVAEWD